MESYITALQPPHIQRPPNVQKPPRDLYADPPVSKLLSGTIQSSGTRYRKPQEKTKKKKTEVKFELLVTYIGGTVIRSSRHESHEQQPRQPNT